MKPDCRNAKNAPVDSQNFECHIKFYFSLHFLVQGGNSVKSHLTWIKFELKLDIHVFLMKYLYLPFQPYTFIPSKVRERKLKRTTLNMIKYLPQFN